MESTDLSNGANLNVTLQIWQIISSFSLSVLFFQKQQSRKSLKVVFLTENGSGPPFDSTGLTGSIWFGANFMKTWWLVSNGF